jgi:iron-sulfur cluster insertion protein
MVIRLLHGTMLINNIMDNPPITLTDNAINYLVSIMNKSGKNHVLLQAKGGGCAGFKYDWSFPETEDLSESDTSIILKEGYNLSIDSYSAFKLFGMSIDYVERLSGSSLEIVNPNAKSTCGCGESFS